MCPNPRIRRQPGRRGFDRRFIQDIAAAASVATVQHRPAPTAAMPQRRMMIALRLRPRTVQVYIHCRQNLAGFWVSRTSAQTARRPSCLSCCHPLDPDRHHVIPFDGHGSAGRHL